MRFLNQQPADFGNWLGTGPAPLGDRRHDRRRPAGGRRTTSRRTPGNPARRGRRGGSICSRRDVPSGARRSQLRPPVRLDDVHRSLRKHRRRGGDQRDAAERAERTVTVCHQRFQNSDDARHRSIAREARTSACPWRSSARQPACGGDCVWIRHACNPEGRARHQVGPGAPPSSPKRALKRAALDTTMATPPIKRDSIGGPRNRRTRTRSSSRQSGFDSNALAPVRSIGDCLVESKHTVRPSNDMRAIH